MAHHEIDEAERGGLERCVGQETVQDAGAHADAADHAVRGPAELGAVAVDLHLTVETAGIEDAEIRMDGGALAGAVPACFPAPGELLPKLGLALKDDLRRSGAGEAAVIGLLNDELGYILPIEDFVFPDNPFEPGDHYEETMSIGLEAGPRLLEGARELILPHA